MVPEELLERFRTLSLERIGRVEAMWNGLVQNVDSEETARQISRDVHTLKGDAAIVGATEVHILCQKLEDLILLAEDLHYDISEDFELVVTMAGGKTYWKVKGGQFTKFGVTVWPEVLKDAGLATDLDPMQVYSLQGYKAFYVTKDEGKPDKVVKLEK